MLLYESIQLNPSIVNWCFLAAPVVVVVVVVIVVVVVDDVVVVVVVDVVVDVDVVFREG